MSTLAIPPHTPPTDHAILGALARALARLAGEDELVLEIRLSRRRGRARCRLDVGTEVSEASSDFGAEAPLRWPEHALEHVIGQVLRSR